MHGEQLVSQQLLPKDQTDLQNGNHGNIEISISSISILQKSQIILILVSIKELKLKKPKILGEATVKLFLKMKEMNLINGNHGKQLHSRSKMITLTAITNLSTIEE